jgi:hypothetical protein
MTTIQFTNEKGNVSAKARKHIKDSVIAKIAQAFEAAGLESVVNADGGLSIAVAQDAGTGNTIFTHLAFTVSDRDPSIKTAKSKTKAKPKTEDVELPDIFAEVEANSETVTGPTIED